MKKQLTEYPSRTSDYGEVITLTATNGLEKHDFYLDISSHKEQGKK